MRGKHQGGIHMKVDSTKQMVRKEISGVPFKDAIAEEIGIFEQNMRLLEAKREMALKILSYPISPVCEAALKSIDCSVQSLRRQLLELNRRQTNGETAHQFSLNLDFQHE